MADSNPLPRPQRLHDLHTVLSNFKAVTRLLGSGYRFDDEDAPAALAQLAKATQILEREIRALESEWKA